MTVTRKALDGVEFMECVQKLLMEYGPLASHPAIKKRF